MKLVLGVGSWTLFSLFALAAASADTDASSGQERAARDDFSSLQTGEQIYAAACATCHGADGRGSSRSTVGFDIPLPDFTDCSFASREPGADWFGIAHGGGRIRAFDPMMPAFGGAISDRQIEKAALHVKSYCRDRSWPPGEFNLPRALGTEKAYPEDEVALELEGTVEEPHLFQATFVFEKRVGSRAQVEAALPVGVQQMERTRADGSNKLGWGEGLGDPALGLKAVLWHVLSAGSIGSLACEVFIPVGDEADGFSQSIFRYEPYLALGQILPGDNFIQLQGGAELSEDTDIASHELFWRAVLGHTFTEGRFGRSWSPMVEVLAAYPLESGAAVEWSVVPELHLTLSKRQHVMVNLGAEIPVTEFDERPVTVAASLLWDWYDGGLTEGW
jgi:hypothetical protein